MTKIEVNAKKTAAAKSKKVTHIAVSSAATHKNVQRSTTLSRRYVRRPAAKATKKINVIKVPTEAAKETAVKETAPKSAAKSIAKESVKATAKSVTVKTAAEAAKKPAKKILVKKQSAKAAAAEKPSRKQARQIEKANAEILKQSKLAAKAQAEAEKKARLAAKAQAEAAKKASLAAARAKAEAERQAKIAERQALRAARKTTAKSAIRKTTSDEKVLKSALRNVASMNEPEEMPKKFNKKRRARRVVFALFCSALTVSALVAFVHFNMPDLSVRVAAMQTGIEATYPSFIPRNYSLSNVSSDKEGEVVMYFNGPDGANFSLSEEKSTWDSTALLNNYVKKNYPSDYITMREQGITIYVRGDKACWVNGGLLYNIHTSGKNLTKEQIRNIATSL